MQPRLASAEELLSARDRAGVRATSAARDDEHEPPTGFLRVERLLLGTGIPAVHICERPPGRRPGSRGDRGGATRQSRRHALAPA